MSKRENQNNAFRPSDRPLTEYEEEQKALRKNLERLKAERLAREKASRRTSGNHSASITPWTIALKRPGYSTYAAPVKARPSSDGGAQCLAHSG